MARGRIDQCDISQNSIIVKQYGVIGWGGGPLTALLRS